MEGTPKPSYDCQLDKPGKISLELNLANKKRGKQDFGGEEGRSELMGMMALLYVGGAVICLGWK